MIERRAITRETLSPILRLKVREDQPDLVAPNSVTVAQVAYEQPGSHVWGLWDGDMPVGLLAMIHPGEYPWMEDGDDPEAAYIWRLMIDAAHQGKGFGRGAIDQSLEVARDWGLPRLSLTSVEKDGCAIPFYETCGFVRTGRIVDGEVEMIRDV